MIEIKRVKINEKRSKCNELDLEDENREKDRGLIF